MLISNDSAAISTPNKTKKQQTLQKKEQQKFYLMKRKKYEEYHNLNLDAVNFRDDFIL